MKYQLSYGKKKVKGDLPTVAMAATLVRAAECDGHMRVESACKQHWIDFAIGERSTTDTASSPEFRQQFIDAASKAVKKHLPG
jgi:hypothetical protein